MCSSSEGFDQSSDPAAAIGIEQVEVPVAMRNQGDVNGTTTASSRRGAARWC
jgi:hypothetical protein